MKLEKLKPGMAVYEVGKMTMGNTSIKSVCVWDVYIVSVDMEKRRVHASWNGNTEKVFYERTWSKWRLKKPLLIRTAIGSYRLATREEILAANNSAQQKDKS